MAASRYVFNFKSHEWVRWTSEISSWTLKEKFHIYKQPCILYHNILTPTIDKPSSERGRFHLKSSGMLSILRRVVNHGFLSWFLCIQRKKKLKFPLRSKIKYFRNENTNSVITDCKEGIKLKLSTLNLS